MRVAKDVTLIITVSGFKQSMALFDCTGPHLLRHRQ